MLRFQQAEFSYEPYPICLIPSAIADADYQEMLKTYPDLSLFEFKPKLGNKYSLSERNNRREYASFISKSPLWSRFHSYIKSRKFIDETLALLKSNNIDLDLDEYMFRGARGKPKRSLMSKLLDRTELNARFEFSIMSSTGGHIRPHTDEPKKLITLVVSILEASEWSSEWGGGTQVCFPKDRTRSFNQTNEYLDFAEVETLRDYAFRPNQCLLFIKTYNSWHHVQPMTAPEGSPMRKTLTINIERL